MTKHWHIAAGKPNNFLAPLKFEWLNLGESLAAMIDNSTRRNFVALIQDFLHI
jgi:hypothetical protein